MGKEKLSLKDMMFNKQRVTFLSWLIKEAYKEFDEVNFIDDVLVKFPELELKERIYHIKDNLKIYLPDNYKLAVSIMRQSLPPELDPNKTDDDFGYFILSSFWEYIAEYWCNWEYLDFSLSNFEEFTKRFSMEFAIRPFLKKYPEQTLVYVEEWSKHDNYHVRRFASEWIRPSLPWWGKVDIGIQNTFDVLDNLFSDHTSYVFRSVANNMNDISKIDPIWVLSKLDEWKKSRKQSEKNMDYIMRHSLRTLLRSGHKESLQFIWYQKPDISIKNFQILTPSVSLWESLKFEFEIDSKNDQVLMIDYIIHFVKASGKNSWKTFKISKKKIWKWENIKITKKHPLREMTTLKLYPWKHFIELQINGEKFGKIEFDFKMN